MSKKSENVTKSVTKVNEMSFFDKSAYLHTLGKMADVKHQLLKSQATDFLNMVNVALNDYPFSVLHEACQNVFDFDFDFESNGELEDILLNLPVKQIHAINRVLLPVLDANMMFQSLDGITSLDEMIKVCETFLDK